MWKINPKLLCRQHLLGEHLETHMFQEHVRHHKNLTGYINSGLVEVHNIRQRHDELTDELLRRGYKHNSPMYPAPFYTAGSVDIATSLKELNLRCTECSNNIRRAYEEKSCCNY